MLYSHLTSAFASKSMPPSKFNIASKVITNANTDILCINICVAIDPMVNFDSDADADIKCEQAFMKLTSECCAAS